MTYEIQMSGENFGIVYAPVRGGLRVVCGIVVRPNANSVTLTRKTAVAICAAANGLGSTVAESTESVRLPMRSFDALAVAHATLTAWAA